MQPVRIDLAKFASEGARVFAGRDRGEAARQKANLELLDQQGVFVEVVVPRHAYSVNSSFFLGMFGDSIRRLGEARFRERYSFSGAAVALVVEDGIREALRTSSPLGVAAATHS